MVGTGAGGTGCSLRQTGWRRAFFPLALRHVGLPADALGGDFDRLYVQRLLTLIRSSSLDAAVILAMDHVYDTNGNVLPDDELFFVPNEYVLTLAREHEEFIPAVSIHPNRRDAMDELGRCLAGGAAILKLLPLYQRIDCNDRRHTRFWERMAEAGLPLLVHTGGEHTVPNNAPRFAHPRICELPLECGVTVIAAHCATKSGIFDRDYVHSLLVMMQKHERLFADNSAFNTPFRSHAFRTALQPPLIDRLLHGSDFPVFVYGRWAKMRGLIDTETFRRCEAEPNVLERDYQLKRAIGFPDAVFTRAATLLRR